jgi:hypothetical protein
MSTIVDRTCYFFFRATMARRLSINEDELILPKFIIESELTRQYNRFNATGTELTLRFLPPNQNDTDPMIHFQASVSDLFD